MKKIDTGLYQGMVNYIEAMVASGKYSSGAKLPSLRELERQFSISFSAVRRGIEELENKGLIESHHGSGNYVTVRARRNMIPANGFRKIAVFLETDNFDSSYCAQALNGAKEYAETNNIALMLNFSPIGTITEEFVISRAEGCDAALFLGCYDLRLRRMPIAIPHQVLWEQYRTATGWQIQTGMFMRMYFTPRIVPRHAAMPQLQRHISSALTAASQAGRKTAPAAIRSGLQIRRLCWEA